MASPHYRLMLSSSSEQEFPASSVDQCYDEPMFMCDLEIITAFRGNSDDSFESAEHLVSSQESVAVSFVTAEENEPSLAPMLRCTL